ncbi:MAG: AAA family ATPase [Acidiphilium sp.]|nr:AAA family ATPase [Acidiphilium sp.]
MKPPHNAPRLPVLPNAKAYWYHDRDGAVLGASFRIDDQVKGKSFAVLSWGATGDEPPTWQWRHWSGPKPLYGLDQLEQRPDAPVIVCEGEKAADAAAALFPDYVAITWPGGTNGVSKADWTPLGARLGLIWPDADKPGADAAREISAKWVAGRIINTDGLPDGFDAADLDCANPAAWLAARLPEDAPFDEVMGNLSLDEIPEPPPIEALFERASRGADKESATLPPSPKTKDQPKTEIAGKVLPYTAFADAAPNLDAADFVEGLLIEGALSVVYGQSNSGKTFWVTDLGFHVAAGMAWNQREVTQGAVLYLALEGAYGIMNRISAFKIAHGLEDASIPFAVVPITIDLLDPSAGTGDVVATIKAVSAQFECPTLLVVVDTVARAIAGGNENSSEDMGAFVRNLDLIRQETGSHVIGVHHSGKDETKGARGWSGLRAAVDTEIEIKDQDGVRSAEVLKQRDMPKGDVFAFTLETITLGTNRRGKEVTSCVVRVPDGQTASAVTDRRRHIKGHTKRALDVLSDLVNGSGAPGYGAPEGVSSVPEKWWRERFYEAAMAGAEQDTKKRAFRRAADELLERRFVAMFKGRVWVVSGRFYEEQDGTEGGTLS